MFLNATFSPKEIAGLIKGFLTTIVPFNWAFFWGLISGGGVVGPLDSHEITKKKVGENMWLSTGALDAHLDGS